jgi:hypothetical protein
LSGQFNCKQLELFGETAAKTQKIQKFKNTSLNRNIVAEIRNDIVYVLRDQSRLCCKICQTYWTVLEESTDFKYIAQHAENLQLRNLISIGMADPLL